MSLRYGLIYIHTIKVCSPYTAGHLPFNRINTERERERKKKELGIPTKFNYQRGY